MVLRCDDGSAVVKKGWHVGIRLNKREYCGNCHKAKPYLEGTICPDKWNSYNLRGEEDDIYTRKLIRVNSSIASACDHMLFTRVSSASP